MATLSYHELHSIDAKLELPLIRQEGLLSGPGQLPPLKAMVEAAVGAQS